MSAPVITIDGPGGAGKGTVASRLAGYLGWHLLDSGAIYRALGLYALRRGVDADDIDGLVALARDLPVTFEGGEGIQAVCLDGAHVGREIRGEQAGGMASRIATLPAVRDALLQRQRDFARPPGLVADGRDMGTVVFTDAPLKIFLTASAEERAKRRHKQLNEQGLGGNLSALLREIEARDHRDATRAVAPLKPADDAQVVDSTDMSISQVVDTILREVRRLGLDS